mmetsp:Transcript_33648/g.60901  ORF Transcript_33648/g.60901 Transcript_33648/m.60901 type:complete len:294 (+) Transcript_33648:54-935(+)|eukprot:CAMPEP_0197639102 /NCGR_PEP_ID=MMETSP1338-20131121/13826_1 /TAXON_ID=43686 ORGANISM="Pelagodinium beii, Strain RCC1491" /NCGR_SAMPLE_ID=MMETSP1338 /ASSEMBLY_ACC=CAM_ASM_000754 /LENGTH=293 /DNA_ID=CAMNT_0043211783 /DNA_START=50 /DNA_END=931 /DNA_ORIENTATION=-
MPMQMGCLQLFCLLCLSRCLAYNQTVGLSLAYLEKAVYCGKDSFDSWDVGEAITKGPRVNSSQVRFVESEKTEAAAGVGRMLEPDGCLVAMRGTLGTISSLLDAEFWLTGFNQASCPGCQVVHGFHSAYESIKAEIFQALDDFGCHGHPLHLVGHSQGAASLTYFLFDALAAGHKVAHMYALESPRPGNAAFSKALRSMLGTTDAWRVSHYQDIVVHLPPPGLYEHALPEIYYEYREGTEYKICTIEEKTCSDQWWPWQLTGADHSWYADINPCSCPPKALMEPELPIRHLII